MKKCFKLIITTIVFLITIVFLSCSHDDESMVEDPSVIEPEPTEGGFKNILYEVDSLGKNTQFFTSYVSSGAVRSKLKTRYLPSHELPTGLYVLPNTPLVVDVEKLSGNNLPTIIIGTISHRSNFVLRLNTGINTISTHPGGLIWIVYENDAIESKAKISFESGHKVAPFYIKNKTTKAEWEERWNGSNDVNDVLLIGEYTVLVFNKDLHANVFTQNNDVVLKNTDKVYKDILDISGLDNSSLIHTHHPAPHLMVQFEEANHQTNELNRAAAFDYRTVYYGEAKQVFSEDPSVDNAIYTMGFEMGHFYEQPTWMFIKDINVIFALQVQSRYLRIPSYKLLNPCSWPYVVNYLNDNSATKEIYQLPNGERQQAMLHQLQLAFGDTFYPKLMKLVREDLNSYHNSEEQRANFILKACIASNSDLSVFFKKWGLLPTSHEVYAQVQNLNLSKPLVAPYLIPYDFSEKIVNGAIYEIQPEINTSSVLTVNGNISDLKPLIVLNGRDLEKQLYQRFLARKMNDGTFVFKSIADTTKVLDSGVNAPKGTQIHLGSYSGTDNQKWLINEFEENVLSIKSLVSNNAYVDVDRAGTSDGTKILVFEANCSKAQQFKLKKVD